MDYQLPLPQAAPMLRRANAVVEQDERLIGRLFEQFPHWELRPYNPWANLQGANPPEAINAQVPGEPFLERFPGIDFQEPPPLRRQNAMDGLQGLLGNRADGVLGEAPKKIVQAGVP